MVLSCERSHQVLSEENRALVHGGVCRAALEKLDGREIFPADD